MKDETLRKAFQNWEALNVTQEEVLAYEVCMKRILDEGAAVREAELRVQESEIRAEKALQRGHQEGRQEVKEITARRLLIKGMEIEDIVEVTELSEEQILKIQQGMES